MNDPKIIAVLWDIRKLRDALKERSAATECTKTKYYLDGQLVAISTAVQLIFHHFPGLDLREFQDAQ